MLIDLIEAPKSLTDLENSWKGAKAKWFARAKEAKQFYLNDVDGTGTTYNARQYENIKNVTNIPVSINYLYPVLSQKSAILSQMKPSHKVVATDGREGSKQVAFVLDKAKHAIMYNSEALSDNEEAIKEMLITGMSFLSWVEQDFVQDGEFGISYTHIPIEYITVDPNSRKRSGLDSRGYFYEKQVTLDVLENLFNPMIKEINEYYGKSYTLENIVQEKTSFQSTPDNIVTSLEQKSAVVKKYYDRTISTMYLVKNPATGMIDRIFRENLFPEEAEIILSTYEIIGETVNRFVRETLMINNKIIRVNILPTTLLPLRIMYFEFGGQPYLSYGMVHFVRGMQEAMDKTIQQLILNAMLMNSAGWTVPKGTIAEEDREKWKIDGSNPMAIKEYTYQIVEGVLLKPERDQVQPLSNHYPLIIELMKSGIEYSTGINAIVSGNPKEAKVDVFSTVQQYQNSAMQRINVTAQHINQCQEYMGRVLIDMLPGLLKVDKYLQFFNEKSSDFDETQVTVELINSMTVGNFLVIAIPAEGTATQRFAMATELMKIAQTTQDPMERNIFIKHAFNLSDMRGYDQVQEELQESQKLQQKVQELEEELERKEELQKQFENRALEAEYRAKRAELLADSTANIKSAEAVTQKDIEINRLKEELKDAKKPKKEGE